MADLHRLNNKILKVEETKYDLATMAYAMSYFSGIMVLSVCRPGDKFTKFHATQSIILGFLLSFAQFLFLALRVDWLGIKPSWWAVFVLVFWVIVTIPLLMMTWRGKTYVFPIAGDLAKFAVNRKK